MNFRHRLLAALFTSLTAISIALSGCGRSGTRGNSDAAPGQPGGAEAGTQAPARPDTPASTTPGTDATGRPSDASGGTGPTGTAAPATSTTTPTPAPTPERRG